ncbi:MAG: hypothetical protein QHJ73_20235, partial [Armatimonadota bacterium]|nr:hypothetical protein [Armatimonadota bacterium]
MRKLRLRRWKNWVGNVLPKVPLVIIPIILWLTWVVVTFKGLAMPEALDQAQAARHLARGDGFVTSAITPLSLVLAPKMEGHPDLSHAPLFGLWESFWF